jgi:hypothetical protein
MDPQHCFEAIKNENWERYICRKRSLNKVVANTSSVAGYFNFLKVSWMPSTADKAERVGKIQELAVGISVIVAKN